MNANEAIAHTADALEIVAALVLVARSHNRREKRAKAVRQGLAVRRMMKGGCK